MRNIIKSALIVGSLVTSTIAMADGAKKPDVTKAADKPAEKPADKKVDAKATDKKATDKKDAKATEKPATEKPADAKKDVKAPAAK